MCQIFAGQDPKGYRPVTRSIRLGGHSTSIRLENAYWEILDEIAIAQDMTTPRFLGVLYDEVLELQGEVRNFASLLRVSCTKFVENRERTIAAASGDRALQRRDALVRRPEPDAAGARA
jgi:predicted DNA-binding ribbon-helix-helix protein